MSAPLLVHLADIIAPGHDAMEPERVSQLVVRARCGTPTNSDYDPALSTAPPKYGELNYALSEVTCPECRRLGAVGDAGLSISSVLK